MEEKTIILLVMSCVFSIAGIALIVSQGLADWVLRKTRIGQRLLRFHGEHSAEVTLRFVIGPMFVLTSILHIWAALICRWGPFA